MEKLKEIIFVCSPLRWETERNIKYVKELCKEVLSQWNIPYAPHLFFTQFLDDNIQEERELWMMAWIEMLKICDNILIGDKYWISEWMKAEIKIFNNL